MHTSKHQPSICPDCGSKKVARILWGMPEWSPKMQNEIDQGKLILGGCVVSDRDPKWQCVDCGTKIFQVNQ